MTTWLLKCTSRFSSHFPLLCYMKNVILEFLFHLCKYIYGLQLLKRFPKELVALKRAQVLSFQMAKPVPFLDLVQQVFYLSSS